MSPLAGTPPEYTKEDLLNLVAQAQAGNQEAFGRLYEYYLNPIYRYILTLVRQPTEAEDLTQEVFIKAWQRLNQYSERGMSIRPWLYTIARHAVFDWQKKRKPVILDEADAVWGRLESSQGQPVKEALAAEEGRLVERALGELGHAEREIIVMYYMSELSHVEIAAILELSEEAVRQRKSRALRTLRGIIARQPHYEGK